MLSPNPVLLELDFCTLEIHENCVISTIKEGVLFDKEERKKLYEIFDKYFEEKQFVYISNRKNDYTVNHLTITLYLRNNFTNVLLTYSTPLKNVNFGLKRFCLPKINETN